MGTAPDCLLLMGAMAIVEVVDAHNGFEVITLTHQDQEPIVFNSF